MRNKLLTLKQLGHVEKGFRLSASYANTTTHYKIVEEYIIGYYFAGDGQRSPIRIAPIYRATVWTRAKGHNAAITSYEIGEYLNPPWEVDENVGAENVGNMMAHAARASLRGLELLAQERTALAKERKATARKKKSP